MVIADNLASCCADIKIGTTHAVKNRLNGQETLRGSALANARRLELRQWRKRGVTMKILLADDHALVREGLRHVLLRLDADVVIVDVADCNEALRVAVQQTDFDLVLLDVAMPGMNRLEGLTRLRERLPSTPIVMLSALEDAELVRDALQRGAQGFVTKSSTGDVMLGALRLVFAGGIYLPPSLLSQAQAAPDNHSNSQNSGNGLGLTPRQREVLVLIVEGKTNKEIGRALNMSETTVRTHVTAIFRTLNVSNRTQASHIAAKHGYIAK